jgi:hypothetical protein
VNVDKLAEGALPLWPNARVMSHLWKEDDTVSSGWSALSLDGAEAVVETSTLRRVAGAEDRHWVMFADEGARVNGNDVPTGIAVLDDRDELLLGGRRFFFSTETLAAVAPQPAADRPVFCPRCKLPIDAGTCWTYAEHCAMCDHPTPLDAGFRFTPEEL